MTLSDFDELVTRPANAPVSTISATTRGARACGCWSIACESAPGVESRRARFVYGQFVDALWNRLRVVDYVKQHPEVADERVERPLVVLGLPRTGTSLASYLLDQDPLRRSLLTWEAEDSVPPSTPETLRTDPRCLKKKARTRGSCRGAQGGQHSAGPLGRGRRAHRVCVRAEPRLQGLPVGGLHAHTRYADWLLADRHDKCLRLRAQRCCRCCSLARRAPGR